MIRFVYAGILLIVSMSFPTWATPTGMMQTDSVSSVIRLLLKKYPKINPDEKSTLNKSKSICPDHFIQDSSYYLNWSSTDSSWIINQGNFWGYNMEGKTTWCEIRSRDQGSNTWIPSSRREYFYNADERLDRFFYFDYNTSSGTWDSISLTSFEYGNDNQLYSRLTRKYGTDNNWINNSLATFTYDTLGRRILYQVSTWDQQKGDWLPSYRELYSWQGNLQTEYAEQNYDTTSSSWVNILREIYSYNDAGLRTGNILFKWDSASGDWVNQTMISYTWSDGILKIQDYQTWQTDHWEETVRYLYFQNETGNDTLILFQVWNSGSSVWTNNYRYLYGYDGCGNLTEETGQLLNSSSGVWDNDWRVLHFVSPFTPGPPLTVQIIDSGNITCHGGNDGWALAKASGGTPPYRWLWDDDPPSTDSIATGLFAGIWYHVTVTDDAGQTVVDSIQLTEPEPVVTGNILGKTQVSLYDTACYFAYPPGNGYYTWLIKGGHFLWPVTGPGTVVAWTLPGEDSIGVFLTNFDGCQGDTVWLPVYVQSPTSGRDLSADAFRIWPNPTHDIIHISDPQLCIISVKLLDLSGRIYKTCEITGAPEYTLNIHDLSPGMYLLKIKTRKGNFLKKIIVR